MCFAASLWLRVILGVLYLVLLQVVSGWLHAHKSEWPGLEMRPKGFSWPTRGVRLSKGAIPTRPGQTLEHFKKKGQDTGNQCFFVREYVDQFESGEQATLKISSVCNFLAQPFFANNMFGINGYR
jgi:hypothetical protein